MRREKPRGRREKGKAAAPGEGAQRRAEELLERLEVETGSLARAAEELDRHLGRLAEAGVLDSFRERAAALSERWAAEPFRGERGLAWLTLVGGFRLADQAPQVALVVRNAGLPASLRMQAARVLAHLGGEEAVPALQEVLLGSTDAQVRAAAAEALGDLRDRSVAPVLATLLEDDLPRPLWNAVSAALDRLRQQVREREQN